MDAGKSKSLGTHSAIMNQRIRITQFYFFVAFFPFACLSFLLKCILLFFHLFMGVVSQAFLALSYSSTRFGFKNFFDCALVFTTG